MLDGFVKGDGGRGGGDDIDANTDGTAELDEDRIEEPDNSCSISCFLNFTCSR